MRQPLTHFLPGAAHAVSMVAVGYPFDTVKTRLQLNLHSGALMCVRSIVTTDGWLALYRGAAMPLASLVCKRPFEFAAFEWFNERFSGLKGASFYGGCLAGFIGAVIGCPFSVVKIQMQSCGKEVHSNTAQAIVTVLKQRGAPGFYQGLSASILMQVPYATVYLGTYGELRKRLPRSALCTAAAGGIASLTTCTLLQPLDTVRTIIQSRALSQENAASLSYLQQVRMVVNERGVLGLWAGWRPSALRAFPASAASMLAYERVRTATGGLVPPKH